MARAKGAPGTFARSCGHDQTAVVERIGHLRGEILSDAQRHDLRRSKTPLSNFNRCWGAAAAKFAGREGDGFICTSGKGDELYRDKLLPAVAEGAKSAHRDGETIE